MTGLGDEIVTRCPTCGYGLTARRYAVPKECPLCRGSFDAEAAPQLMPAHESEKEDVVEDEVKKAVAEDSREEDEPGERRITLSVRPDVETGPLGFTTQRMPDPELEEVPPEPAADEPPHIEHAVPAASAGAEQRAFVPPTTKIDTFQTPPLPPSPLSQPPPPQQQPVSATHARGSLEERVSPEVVGRYADAYRAARAAVLIGNLIKVFGVLLGLLVGGGLFALIATQGRLFGGTGAVGFFAGLVVGGSTFAFFFVLGVVISAQGQLIKATLDGAVNSSPFLTNDQRAEAMSLR